VTDTLTRYVLTESDRAKANSPEVLARRQKRHAFRSDLRDQGILNLWRIRRMVPLAIADRMDTTVERVVKVLRDAGEDVPSYLTQTGGRRRCSPCTCGRFES
jgi:hypothetical protein